MGSEWILRRLACAVWIGFDCLRTGTGGGLWWVRWWTFGFLRHGVRGDISKLISEKQDMEVWTDYVAQGAIQRQDAVSSYTSCGQYHDWVSDNHLLKKHFSMDSDNRTWTLLDTQRTVFCGNATLAGKGSNWQRGVLSLW
jgi:hypothetical protein